MRTRLIVMRHAKSSWSDASLEDHDRPLNKRGRSDAPPNRSGIAQARMDSLIESDVSFFQEDCGNA